MSKIEISGIGRNLTVKVDGQSLPVVSADLHVDAQSLPQLTVTVDVLDLIAETEGDVKVSDFCETVLLALGWTPPAGQCCDNTAVRNGARHILAQYDNPPADGTLVPRAWVEANREQLEQMAEL